MNQEFEVIAHGTTNYKIFLVNLLYRTPHVHRDFELGYVLENEVTILVSGETHELHAGDFWIMNPFQSHELKAEQPALLLSIQVPASFFSGYYRQIEAIEFTRFIYSPESNPMTGQPIGSLMHQMASQYFHGFDFYELKCAALLNECLYQLLTFADYHFITEKEQNASKNKAIRMRSVLQYIDENYMQKLLLTDIAERENLSLYYLSHLFKESLGMSFQDYLLKIRCEKARHLLLLTEQSLLDICIASGFSDPKYFNIGFKRQYGCTPKEYRKQFYHEELSSQQKSMLTTQEFLSTTQSLITLEKFISL